MSMSRDKANKVGDFTFIVNYFKNPSKQLEEGSEWKDNKWKEFFIGCSISFLTVMYIGVISANFIFFSKLPRENKFGEETIHTYFPIAAAGPDEEENPFFRKFFSYPVLDRDYGDYQNGSSDDIETKYGGHLRKLNIPPTGVGNNWYLRFPYNLMNYRPETAQGWVRQFFYGRLSWIGRSVAATYIFWRKILHLIFNGTNSVGNLFKIIITLICILFVIAGPKFVLTLGKEYSGLNFSGFSSTLIISLLIISITQARFDTKNSYLWAGIGWVLQFFFLFMFDLPAIGIVGQFIGSFFIPLQFMFTFILPFNAIMNQGQILDNMKEIRGALALIYTALCVLFAQLYLNKTVFSGMLLVILPYLLLQVVRFFKWLTNSLKTKTKDN